MSQLINLFRQEEFKLLFQYAFEVRFITTLSAQAQITICYRQQLSEAWLPVASEAAKRLGGIKIIGRARKCKRVAGGKETIVEEYNIKDEIIKIVQTEGAFSQPNGTVSE